MAACLEISFRALMGNMVGLSDRQSHNSQRGIFTGAGGELTTVGNEQILDVMGLPPFVANTIAGFLAHAASPEIMC